MRPMTITLLVILGISLMAGWFFATHEKVEEEQWVGLRGEARINDFYAAELLLRELGFEAESRPTLTPTEWLPSSTDTIILRLTPSITIGDERSGLLDWVGAGGHIVFLPPLEETNDVESFLEEFALDIAFVDEPEDDEFDEEPSSDTGNQHDNEYAIEAMWDIQQIKAIGEPDDIEVIRHHGRIFVARRPYYDGFVTLLADGEPFENLSIGTGDNARLFADVVVGTLEPGKVWITFETSFAPLWKIIWLAAPFVVVAIALLLVLWIWHAMPAFGPKSAGEAASRRSIIEHIRASGIFTWRKHGAGHLMESSTQALVHDADAKHPGLSKRSAEEQAAVIARITGMPAQKVMDALHGHPDPKHREFTHSMQKLQSIRKEL
ncbi:MAG: DUF4350 domain-containing protein [Pseudomonadota bacterium]